MDKWTRMQFELHQMYGNTEKDDFTSLHLEKSAHDWFFWWHSKAQSRASDTFRKYFFKND